MTSRQTISAVLLTALGAGAATAEPATWQQREASFSFMGWNTLYTCDSLEDKVRDILRALGARSDVVVRARGCFGAQELTRNSWVTVRFHTLAPGAGNGAVDAQWTSFKTQPGQLSTLSTGDCELIEDLKGLITGNFAMRGATYRTSCTPGRIAIADFSGEVLKAK